MIRIRGMASLTKHPNHPGSTLRVFQHLQVLIFTPHSDGDGVK